MSGSNQESNQTSNFKAHLQTFKSGYYDLGVSEPVGVGAMVFQVLADQLTL